MFFDDIHTILGIIIFEIEYRLKKPKFFHIFILIFSYNLVY